MYTLISSLPARRIFTEQIPELVIALVVAELLYKFHSFLLECLAFLATWFVLDFVCRGLGNLLARNHGRRDSA